MVKEFSIYDILGVLAPGAVVVVGVITLFPDAASIVSNKEFTFGEFGLIVLVSYIAGNLVAGVGNFLEWAYRKACGGSHTAVALGPKTGEIIRTREREATAEKLKELGFIGFDEKLGALSAPERQALGGRMYTYIEARQRTRRIDLFNAQYGMNRGIGAGFITLIGIIAIQTGSTHWRLLLILGGCAILAFFRMDRFSRYYTRELIRQFLEAPEKIEPPKEG